ncbi:MAG: hypothetical protein UX72_C0001G0091 [Parcubacteria group bacterium GW2011_GWA2_47_10]|nr:MAG: hypothetical protein UX72_C0001G0091 [Parcubacteria group bacterium GW2011_GWA2_47_10]
MVSRNCLIYSMLNKKSNKKTAPMDIGAVFKNILILKLP